MLAYLRLVRWPNLLVVAITQYLLRYCIIIPLLEAHELQPALSNFSFAMLVLATLCVTAAGYAINDYFDIRTDRINKPHKIILGRKLSRRKAILLHSALNATGLLLGIMLAWHVKHLMLALIFLVVPILLWMYAVRYKRKFLIGNFIVALLAAFVSAIVWVFDFHALSPDHQMLAQSTEITQYVQIYALFAFLATLVRELIKDIEDIKGDAKTGCRTIPISAGVSASKKLIIFLIITLIIFVAYFQLQISKRDFDLLFVYLLVAVQIPLIMLINKVIYAKEKMDYHIMSRLAKTIMISGVISMFLLFFYLRL